MNARQSVGYGFTLIGLLMFLSLWTMPSGNVLCPCAPKPPIESLFPFFFYGCVLSLAVIGVGAIMIFLGSRYGTAGFKPNTPSKEAA